MADQPRVDTEPFTTVVNILGNCSSAYLEATDKIDWRTFDEPMVIGKTPKPVNVEAGQASSSPFVFGRANLVREP